MPWCQNWFRQDRNARSKQSCFEKARLSSPIVFWPTKSPCRSGVKVRGPWGSFCPQSNRADYKESNNYRHRYPRSRILWMNSMKQFSIMAVKCSKKTRLSRDAHIDCHIATIPIIHHERVLPMDQSEFPRALSLTSQSLEQSTEFIIFRSTL
jgi:hypothetical protein